MRKSTILLAAVLMLFLVVMPSSADKLTLTGEYTTYTINENLIEENGFNSILGPHSLSLNLGYTHKDTEFNVGIKNFDLGYDVSEIGVERYILGQSIYASIDSNNFKFSYLRGDYDKYNFDPADDVIGFNFLYQDLNVNMPMGSNQYNYLLPGFDNTGEYNLVHKNLFSAAINLGKLNVVGYYFDSERILTKFNYFDPYAVYSSRSYNGGLLGGSMMFSGPAINAVLSLSPYFNIGVTYSDIAYNPGSYPGYSIETLNFNIHGKLPILSGGYFVNALKTTYDPILSATVESDKYTIYAGLEEVGLRDDSKVKIGVDYVYSDKNTKLFTSYDSALGQMGIYKHLHAQNPYEIFHRAGVSLGIDFTENLSLDINNGILFSKNTTTSNTQVIGNITTLNFNYEDAKDNKFAIYAINDYDLLSQASNKKNTLYAEAFGKIGIGDSVDIGVKSENRYSFVETLVNDFSGASNLWLTTDMLFDLGQSSYVDVLLGGSVGIIYGNLYNDMLNANGNKLGRFSYDLFAGIDSQIIDRLNLKFGIYAGTDTYIAHALLNTSGALNMSSSDFLWSDVNLVTSATIGYDISSNTTISLTGTYRNWKYALQSDSNSYLNDYKVVEIADAVDPDTNTKYFLQAKVTFKPTDNVQLSLALGQDGLANQKATQSNNAMPWDYLKVPISFEEMMTFKHIELNVSIKF